MPSAAPSTAEDFNLTDSGNAEYFASERGGELRYDTRRDRWLQYRKHRWGVIDKTVVLKLGRDTVRQRQIDALKIESPSKKAEHTKWALRSESRTRIDSMIYLSRGQPAIWDDGKNWDADPLLLGVANGIVDLRTGALRDGRPDDRVTQHCAVKYDANARCPRWERFLREVFEPYPELVPFIQCAVGYSLTGETG